jgi:hypothetical protein
MTPNQVSSPGKNITAPTLGALGLFLFVVALLVTSEKGSHDYRSGQNAVFVALIVFSMLFLTRLVWLQHRVPLNLDGRQWASYARSGALAVDLSFTISAAVFVWIGDFSLWRDYGVRIGTVVAIVLVRLCVSVIDGLRRKRSSSM